MKRCKNCVYLKSGINFRYCMFLRTPKCPGDDGKPVPKTKNIEENKAKVEERGIEIPPPYQRRNYAWRFDYFQHHDKIFHWFYYDGYTYQDIADELGDASSSRGVRAYIMKCEAEHDKKRWLRNKEGRAGI